MDQRSVIDLPEGQCINPNDLHWYLTPEAGFRTRRTEAVIVGDGDGWRAEVDYRDPGHGSWMPWFHIEVYKASPRVLREISARKHRMRGLIEGPMFALGPRRDLKHAKFVRRFDFQLLDPIFQCSDGEYRTLWVHMGYPVSLNKEKQ